jgi:hypothetical protein
MSQYGTSNKTMVVGMNIDFRDKNKGGRKTKFNQFGFSCLWN